MTHQPDHSERETDRQRRLRWRLRRSAQVFETGVLEDLVALHEDDVDLLVALGEAYSRLKRHRQGLEVDRELVRRRPDEPAFRYNLACSLCLTGDLNGACGALLEAIERGFRDFEHLLADEDLSRLRGDNRFGLVRDAMAGASPQAPTT